MRAALKWALGLSACASAASLLWPADAPPNADPTEPGPASLPVAQAPTLLAAELPQALPAQRLQPTPKDPFASVPVVKPPPAAPVAALPPPEPPRAPPMTYRYLGSFTGPDHRREIYLTKGDRSIAVREGMQLEGGFQVAAISATAINVLHAASQTRIDIPIAQHKELP